MDKPIDHQTVSEHLPALLSGELNASDASALEEHISTCEQCRTEMQVLELLQATPPEESLTAMERAALERGVMAGISEETGEHAVVPMRKRTPVGQRFAQVLGAAATIAVLATLVYFGTGGGGGEDSAQSGPEGTTAAREAPEESRRGGDRMTNKARGTAGGGSAGSTTTQDAAMESAAGDSATGFKAAPRPTFRVEDDPQTASELQKRGESSIESVTFANYYSANDAGQRLALLDQLVDAARTKAGDEVAGQVEQCGGQVLDTEDPTIPTFGSIGRLNGRDVLILGFVWTRSSPGAFDRYMVWAWERGSCDVAVDFIEGRIETQN